MGLAGRGCVASDDRIAAGWSILCDHRTRSSAAVLGIAASAVVMAGRGLAGQTPVFESVFARAVTAQYGPIDERTLAWL